MFAAYGLVLLWSRHVSAASFSLSPPPLEGTTLYIAIGIIGTATLSAGVATYSLAQIAFIETQLIRNREEEEERRQKQEEIDSLPSLESTPPETTEDSDISLWDADPTTEETETAEVEAEETLRPLLPPTPYFHQGLLAFACLIAFFLQLTLIYWYIEDAAISFAYAKHFAHGEGLVTYLGGERVEGYSNPLWTFLLALGYLAGVDGFTSSKIYGLFFGVLTVPVVYSITRHLRPHRQDATPIVAAFLVAGNAQFAIWGAAGLENSLFNILLACGVWRVIIESQRLQMPYSALFFFALAVTRPEGIMYAAFAGVWLTLCLGQKAVSEFREQQQRGKGTKGKEFLKIIAVPLAWLALFFGPFLAYHYARYTYFAWEFPNTYYAKKGHRVFEPFGWTRRGWRYLRDYSHELWQGYLLPVYLLAMTGSSKAGRAICWGLVCVLGIVLWMPAPDFMGHLDVSEHLIRITAVSGLFTGITITWTVILLYYQKKKPSVELGYFTLLTVTSIILCALWWANGLEMPKLGSWRAPGWWIETRVWTLVAIAGFAVLMTTGLGQKRSWIRWFILCVTLAGVGGAIGGLIGGIWGAVTGVTAGFALSLLQLLELKPQPGWRGLGLCWGMAICSIFFSLYATGDWMRGFRWMASLVVTTTPLMAIGLANLGDWLNKELDNKIVYNVGITLGVFAMIGSVIIGLIWGVFSVTGVLDLQFSLWPIDTVSAMLIVPLAILTGLLLGLKYPTNRQWRALGYAVVTGGAAIVLVPQFHHLDWFTQRPETGPFSVRKRVNYNQYLMNRLHLHDASMMDVDMGATMYWSGFEIIDIAGLVDVSMGHHWMEKPFIREYILEEKKPSFAHVHGAWARTSKLPQHPEWRRDYIEVPGYPTSKRTVHPGNHIRRDLLMNDKWGQQQKRRVVFENGVMLMGWKTAGAQLSPGRKFFLEVALKTPFKKKGDNFRLMGFIAGPEGELKVFDIPPGYDWYPPHKWGTQDIFFGRYSISLPAWFKSGRYDLGFVLMDSKGRVVPPQTKSELDPTVTPEVFIPSGTVIGTEEYSKFAIGEIRFTRVLQMSSTDDLVQMAGNDVEESVQVAQGDQCKRAENLWFQAQRRLTRDTSWAELVAPTVRPELARCWTRRATQLEDYQEQVPLWVKARKWDRWEPTLLATRQAAVIHWFRKGQSAREKKDWETAYRAYANAVAIDPSQAHARRWAEEARDHRLGLHPEDKPPPKNKNKRKSPSPLISPFKKPGSLELNGRPKLAEPVLDGVEGDEE